MSVPLSPAPFAGTALSADPSLLAGRAEPGHEGTDPVEAYFECITTCSLEDGECVTQCVELLRENG
jgi:hypothetical protein